MPIKNEQGELVVSTVEKAKEMLDNICVQEITEDSDASGVIGNAELGLCIVEINDDALDEYKYITREIVRMGNEFVIDIKYPDMLQKVIDLDFDEEKLFDYIEKQVLVQYERERIRMRKIRSDSKIVAEKAEFGKEKGARKPMSEDLRSMIFDKYKNECVTCGAKEGLHIHHRNNNRDDNRIENLVVLCGVCHKKIHMRVR